MDSAALILDYPLFDTPRSELQIGLDKGSFLLRVVNFAMPAMRTALQRRRHNDFVDLLWLPDHDAASMMFDLFLLFYWWLAAAPVYFGTLVIEVGGFVDGGKIITVIGVVL